ncbi:MAG: MarR family transcriptional regulator [Methylocystis sp.]|nr:MarR family transcriptional regulator [Methylocystis sp.]
MKEVKLHVETLDDFARRSMEMARRLDQGVRKQGKGLGKELGHISFESMEGLLKVLTPNRWRLLRALRNRGPLSVRALARSLDRDYRGAHADVALLIDAGLIERNEQGAIFVPWTRITAEMAVDIAA